MASNAEWDLNKLVREMWEWCKDPEVVETKRTRPIQEIRAFLAQKTHDDIYRLVFPLQWLGMWEGAYGAALILGGKDEGWVSLNKGLLFQVWHMRIALRLYDLNPIPPERKVFPVSQAQAANAIAHAIAAGFEGEIGWLAARMKSGLKDGSFGRGLPATPLAPYVLTLLDLLRMEPIEETALGPYQGIIESWTADPVTFMEALGAACDYHVSRFRAAEGATEEPEFADYPYVVFPAEISATLRVRAALDMSAAAPDHPLLSPRFTDLPAGMPPIRDAVFAHLARAAKEAFPDIDADISAAGAANEAATGNVAGPGGPEEGKKRTGNIAAEAEA
ncbi:MAG: hypothetical protein N3A38_10515 [Planctomycetota bacterium]|nr:hypothetical protein [Planctomycetota bacterium]